jgi:transposase
MAGSSQRDARSSSLQRIDGMKGGWKSWRLTRFMNQIIHPRGAAATAVAGTQHDLAPAAIKLGVDIHQEWFVVVAQEGHVLPKPARRLRPAELVPWVERLLARGHAVFVVYEACGFGFGLCRQLQAAGATCYVIAPRKLDEQRKGVKTDALDAAALCQRLSRYVAGNLKELAVIRVPTEEEEQVRHVHRQREALVRARTKLQAQGRGLLVTHGSPAPPRWWRAQGWTALEKVLPAWLRARLEVFRPVLATLDAQIAALTVELEQAARPELPGGLGKLTQVVVSREVCDWARFKNRRQVSSYTGLCPGESSSGSKRVTGSVTKHGNPRLRAALVECAWRLVRFQPGYPPVRKRLPLLAKGAKATGAARKKAIVAVARQLAVDLWRLHTGQCTAEKLGLTC